MKKRGKYYGGGSLLRAGRNSGSLAFGTYDDAEERTAEVERPVVTSPKWLRERAEWSVGAPADLGKIDRQRAFLVSFAKVYGEAKSLPERILPELRREVLVAGGLLAWAKSQDSENENLLVDEGERVDASVCPHRTKRKLFGAGIIKGEVQKSKKAGKKVKRKKSKRKGKGKRR